MPGSMPEGKEFTRQFLLNQDVKRVLDVGPGSGNYYDLLNCQGEYHGWGPPYMYVDIEWVAIEIFEPYIPRFGLTHKYRKIYVADAYELNWDGLGQFDVIFLGDVLEHMTEDRGRSVIAKAVAHGTHVVISLPIVDYPQGPSYGNVHETHVEQYTPSRLREILKDYKIVASHEGEIVGVYIITGG